MPEFLKSLLCSIQALSILHCDQMSIQFVLFHNFTKDDDAIKFANENVSMHAHWSRDEVQIFVLAGLLVFIVLGFIIVAAVDCMKQIYENCFKRQEDVDEWKAPPLSMLAPPPYSSTQSLATIA
ncbi:unnamed protein product [Cylicocyclus nassatus]|uniref:Uncharacterized protein n=1 Tax=Cylicocyclus nassatus TaxID=53992 RepID=A0AA36DLZ7_CYLNA|nr:unnamed protein product [Cylicocyclus nassatus]